MQLNEVQCDEVLKRMKRMYSVALYDDMLHRIRETIPGASVSSDFIVGFCGETEASFQRSVELCERARFKNSFIFKYSPRTSTKADTLFVDDVCSRPRRSGGTTSSLAAQNRISAAAEDKLGRSSAGRSRSSSRDRAR